MSSNLTRLVAVYRALGHPARLRILAMLDSGELCVCQITAVLNLAPSTISAHLSELKDAGLLDERKEGRWVICRHADGEDVRRVIVDALSRAMQDPRIEADARVVKRLRRVPVEELCRVGRDLARLGIRDRVVAEGQVQRS